MAAVGLSVAFGLKYRCVLHGWVDNFQYTNLCYNEIQALFGVRGIRDGLLPYRDTTFEYPVLTGMFMDLAGRILRGLHRLGLANNDSSGYLLVSSALLAPFSLAVTMMLRSRVGAGRLALWALGVPTLVYTFHNWDVLAVWGGVLGVAMYERRRPGAAGAALAAGASAKLFPAFMAPGMVLARWGEGDRPAALKVAAGFVALFALVNLPWVVVAGGPPAVDAGGLPGVDLRDPATNGWLQVWLFHAGRYPDYWTAWYWLAEHVPGLRDGGWFTSSFRSFVSLYSFALFAAAAGFMLAWGWRRRNEPQGYPVVATGLGIVVAFLLTSKVYSPQYALWAVPLLVLLDVRARYVMAYFAAELGVLISGFGWFTVFDQPESGFKTALEVSVWLRAGVLVLLFGQALRASRLHAGPSATPASGPA